MSHEQIRPIHETPAALRGGLVDKTGAWWPPAGRRVCELCERYRLTYSVALGDRHAMLCNRCGGNFRQLLEQCLVELSASTD